LNLNFTDKKHISLITEKASVIVLFVYMGIFCYFKVLATIVWLFAMMKSVYVVNRSTNIIDICI